MGGFVSQTWQGRAEWCRQQGAHNCTLLLLNGCVLFGGFYINPRNENHDDMERLEQLHHFFHELDAAKNSIRAKYPDMVVIIYGYLNPTPGVTVAYRLLLKDRGMRDLLLEGVVTQVAGRQLERAATDAPWGVSATVHDGVHCRLQGCQLAHCGDHASFFNTQDIDHWLVTIRLQKRLAERAQGEVRANQQHPTGIPNWLSSFAREQSGWQTSLTEHIEEFCSTVSAEINLRYTHAGTWREAPEATLQKFGDLVAWVWRTATYLAAMRGGLLKVRQLNTEGATKTKACPGAQSGRIPGLQGGSSERV